MGQLVRNAPAEHRDIAIRALVDTARAYRDRAGWTDIAIAAGVTVDQLRQWRDEHPGIAKRDVAIQRRVMRPPSPAETPMLLIVTGHPDVRPRQTNDFTTETAMIRERCEHRFTVKEIAGIALHDIPHAIDDNLPAIVHLAAHSDYGEIFLSHNGAPMGITRSLLVNTLLRSTHKTTALVLNFCDSLTLAQTLADADHIVIAWPSTVDDKQCREFNDVFYRMLARGRSIGASFDDAEITVSRWTDLLKPRLLGDRSIHI
ncbi:hypothetical protein ACIRRA_45690 [Nocardia sp. NPDC101769]|uniref:hypothetical protein n=1 Tax=Nocardia sp. NPDC101769 TaxID=3364333 RepID=UPI00382390EF